MNNLLKRLHIPSKYNTIKRRFEVTKQVPNVTSPRWPRWALRICQMIQNAGFSAYLVGGVVRDALLGREATDIDIASSAAPEEIEKLFYKTRRLGVFGTVCIDTVCGTVEITPFRSEDGYSDSRHPDQVSRVSTFSEDVKRRDFTINALGFDGNAVVDLVGGQRDLQMGIIRAVGDAKTRFSEDALRILRAYRFAAQLGFALEEQTQNAARQTAEKLQNISKERIWAEFVRVLSSLYPQKALDIFSFAPLSLSKVYPIESLPCDVVLRLSALLWFAGLDELQARCYLQNLKVPRKIICAVCDRVTCMRSSDSPLALAGRYPIAAVQDALFVTRKEDLRILENALRDGICLNRADLAIDGNDIKALGREGALIRSDLLFLLSHVQHYPADNTPEKLLEIMKRRILL